MKKTNIQLTINEETLKTLESVKNTLSKRFKMELTKSQIIEYLINDFKESKPKTTPNIKSVEKPIKTPKLTEKTDNLVFIDKSFLKDNLLILRDQKLKTTTRQLAESLNINYETMKHYFKGDRNATGENAEKILKSFKENGIN